jgi:hypothetical protein
MSTIVRLINGGGDQVDYVLGGRSASYIEIETARSKESLDYIGKYIYGEIVNDFVVDTLQKAGVLETSRLLEKQISMICGITKSRVEDVVMNPDRMHDCMIADGMKAPDVPNYKKIIYKIDENTIPLMNDLKDDIINLELYYVKLFALLGQKGLTE